MDFRRYSSYVAQMTARERWGYCFWGAVGAMIALPEIWAAAWSGGPWPTISGMTGHLEELWSPTAILVVAGIVVAAVQAVRFRTAPAPLRTAGGRTTRRAPPPAPPTGASLWGYLYVALAVVCVAVPSVLVGTLSTSRHTKWILGYVIYGLIGFFCVALPSALAYWLSRDIPFPTLFQTIADLERRARWVAIVTLAGLVVLLIHLALYPWPDIAHHNPGPKAP